LLGGVVGVIDVTVLDSVVVVVVVVVAVIVIVVLVAASVVTTVFDLPGDMAAK
jgi:hypothetical protein